MRPTPVNPVCQLPMEAGPCYALMPRFFFNFETRRCEQFIYGGCRGNKNNFGTMQVMSCSARKRLCHCCLVMTRSVYPPAANIPEVSQAPPLQKRKDVSLEERLTLRGTS